MAADSLYREYVFPIPGTEQSAMLKTDLIAAKVKLSQFMHGSMPQLPERIRISNLFLGVGYTDAL